MQDRYWQAKKITLFGALKNSLLGIMKLITGFLFHSHALIADGVHSLSDLISDSMVLFASRYGSQAADHSHPYGHQRIETAATLLLAQLLILAGFGIAWGAVNEIFYRTLDKPGWPALPVALISIIANELLFHYTRRVGKTIQSNLLIANAWHHRSDAASSIVVAVGLVGSLAGFVYLDAVAAIIVGLMIIQMGISYGWNSVKELVDTAVDPQMLTRIEKLILNVNGVLKIHQLRSRLMGGDILIDVHIIVSSRISVSEGHFIAQQVDNLLTTRLMRVRDVVVHVDPEDDEIARPSLHLPNRKVIEEQTIAPWKEAFPEIQEALIHYQDGQINIDLICQPTASTSSARLQQVISSSLESQPFIHQVRILNQDELINTPLSSQEKI